MSSRRYSTRTVSKRYRLRNPNPSAMPGSVRGNVALTKKINTQITRKLDKSHSMLNVTPVVVPQGFTALYDLTALSCTTAGSAYSEPRDSVRVINHGINIHMQLNANTASPFQSVRITIFVWKASSSVPPVEGQIFAIPNATVGGNNAHSFLAYNLKSTYSLLYDRRFTCTYNSIKQNQLINIRLSRKKLPKQSMFDNPTSNNGGSHVYMVITGDQLANQPTYSFNSEYIFSE